MPRVTSKGWRAYCDDALEAEAALGRRADVGGVEYTHLVAMTEGKSMTTSNTPNALWRSAGQADERVPRVMALTGAAMAHALKGDDMAVATAEIDEALTLARELAIPSLLGSTRASAAFVLADVQPDRASPDA